MQQNELTAQEYTLCLNHVTEISTKYYLLYIYIYTHYGEESVATKLRNHGIGQKKKKSNSPQETEVPTLGIWTITEH
jgi:hypothetical protein